MENLSTGRQPDRTWPDGSPGLNWTLEAAFDLFPNLAAMRKRLAGAMSGGEQQMLTVTRTLIGSPYCLLLDKPPAGIPPLIDEQMDDRVSACNARRAIVCIARKSAVTGRGISTVVDPCRGLYLQKTQ